MKTRSTKVNLMFERKRRNKKKAKTTNSGRGINNKVRDHNGKERGRKIFGPKKEIKLNLEGFSLRCIESLQERIELRQRLSLSRVEEKEERGK